ncbi:hypothetical protein DV735_g3936, partial [Chaetothyriales sp. CBS 134920]
MSAAEDPRSATRRVDPKAQKPSTGPRDGMAGPQQSRRGGKASLSLGRQPDSVHSRPTAAAPSPPPPQPEAQPLQEDKPLNAFDSAEILTVLKAGVDLKAPLYKPDARSAAPKGSPWGTKREFYQLRLPGAMANGKDFWLELRRQTAALLSSDGERRVTEFQGRVYAHLLVIPEGKVTSYGALAKALNSSPRAVGGALRSNPWAPEVPCHRVIASDGFVGGFKGDWQQAPSGVNQSLKLKLLKEEGVNFTSDGKLVTTRTVWFDGPWDTTETSKQIAARSRHGSKN